MTPTPWVPQWSLADRLRKIRRDSHLGQEEFAQVLGIKPTTYAAWEAGRNQPERVLELAGAIEEAFDVPAAWTLGLMDRAQRVGDAGERRIARGKFGRRATDLVVA
jgi:DNA-binding XRE family transcriptional regulator